MAKESIHDTLNENLGDVQPLVDQVVADGPQIPEDQPARLMPNIPLAKVAATFLVGAAALYGASTLRSQEADAAPAGSRIERYDADSDNYRTRLSSAYRRLASKCGRKALQVTPPEYPTASDKTNRISLKLRHKRSATFSGSKTATLNWSYAKGRSRPCGLVTVAEDGDATFIYSPRPKKLNRKTGVYSGTRVLKAANEDPMPITSATLVYKVR